MGWKVLCAVLLVCLCFPGVDNASGATSCNTDAGQCAGGGVVYGHATAASVNSGAGVVGISDGTNGAGIQGYATAGSGNTYGVYGQSSSVSGTGVYGWATYNTSNGYNYGVVGRSDNPIGVGVYGNATSSKGSNYGVVGVTASTTGTGVYGNATTTTGKNYGVVGMSQSRKGRGVYGGAMATAGPNYGVYGYSASPGGYAVYAQGNLHATGNFSAGGSKSAVVRLESGEGVKLYAEEGAENWFFDAGSAELKDGAITVRIDPTFAKTVNTTADYLVFVTAKGDCGGLYVSRQGETSFEVKEIGGGQSNTAFNYRIMAKRKGYEGERLARVTGEELIAIFSPEEHEGNADEKLANAR